MLLFDSLIVELVVLLLSILGLIAGVTLFVGRTAMKLNAKKMERMNLVRTGSLVSHGMVFDDERGVGVIRDSKPSDNWFRRIK